MPRFFVRDVYSDWENTGKQTVEQRAAAQVEHILTTHQPVPLHDDAQKEIDAIYDSAKMAATNK